MFEWGKAHSRTNQKITIIILIFSALILIGRGLISASGIGEKPLKFVRHEFCVIISRQIMQNYAKIEFDLW